MSSEHALDRAESASASDAESHAELHAESHDAAHTESFDASAPDSGYPPELVSELDRIAALPVAERAAEFSRLHQQLGQLLESTPVALFEEDRS